MQLTALWGEEEVAVEVDAECRTLAALNAALQDALPELDVETVRLEVDGQQLAADDDVCGLEAGGVIKLSATTAALAATTLREEGCPLGWEGYHSAAAAGDLRRCALYLDAGDAGVEGFESDGCLAMACSRDQLEVAKFFLDRGRAADEKDSDGDTPLHNCCGYGCVGAAKLLLDHGAAIDEQNGDGDTPLHLACDGWHFEVAKLLLDRGAGSAKNRAGNSPLVQAIRSDDIRIVEFLAEFHQAHGKDEESFVPFRAACEGNNFEIAKILEEQGCAISRDCWDVVSRSDSPYNDFGNLLRRVFPDRW